MRSAWSADVFAARCMKRRQFADIVFVCFGLVCFLSLFFGDVAQARTWGTKPFENDAAVSWIADLKLAGADSIANALKRVTDEKSGMVSADICAMAIAAASIVAAARDGSTDLLDADAQSWLQSSGFKPDSKLSKQAKTAVQTCRGASRSELYMYWMAMTNATSWIDTVKTLMKRLED
jgi:hypothetical protein